MPKVCCAMAGGPMRHDATSMANNGTIRKNKCENNAVYQMLQFSIDGNFTGLLERGEDDIGACFVNPLPGLNPG